MTARERKLSILLGAALGVVLVMLGIKWLKDSTKNLKSEVDALEEKIQLADANLRLLAESEDFETFLQRYEPSESRSRQEVQSQLLQYCEQRIKMNQLTSIKSPRFAYPDDGANYSRVRISLNLRGEERNMISFLTQMTDPQSFRNVARLSMEPQAKDETNSNVDVELEIDQWFIRKTDEELAAEVLPESADSAPEEEAAPEAPAPAPVPSSKIPGLPPGLSPNDV